MALIPDTLPLYEPIQQLKSFGDHLWIVDGPVVRMALYGEDAQAELDRAFRWLK